MKIRLTTVLSFYLLFSALSGMAQFDPKKVCRVEDGRLVFTLDTRWNAAQRNEIAVMYDLDSALVAGAYALKPVIKENNNSWTTRKIDASHIELSKEQGATNARGNGQDKIFLLDDKSVDVSTVNERESVPYGVNRNTRNSVLQVAPGKVRFYLPGHREAHEVFLSGSFNSWATRNTPMHPCDSGWTVTMKLLPGKYSYKFIIDGRWTNDAFNKLHENDTYHGYNNVFFCYNYRFVLNGYSQARNVLVSGSFNGWNVKELRMIRINGTWMLPLYLRDGTHAYKFIVDQKWITDPANKVTRPDGKGHQNSFLGLGDTLFFRLKGYQNARQVVVAGNFNVWNTAELLMEKTDGGWQLPYVLAPGNYEYKFVVDGKWITDPDNPYTAGDGEQANSFLTVKPNQLFKLEKHPGAKKVCVSGSFNGWSNSGYRMSERDGNWYLPLFLKPGKHTYKYIVDGKWIVDPGNELWEENEYNTGNSVIWIEP
ncbi:MAG: glycogen-binding domain-containing protein [Bacteroidota bacterium]